MAYAKTHDGQVTQFPYSIGKFRQDNPNTSFPRRISDALLASYGVYEVEVEDAPVVDEKTHKAVRSDTPVEVSGKWVLQWSAVEKTAEEKQTYYDGVANRARAKRNALLSETDYLALSDNTLSPEMAAYRQALRDITSQEGFPYDITWPTKPE